MGFSSLSSLYPVARLLALVGAVICVSSATVAAQLQQGSIQGAVLDADGRLVDGAVVTLLDGLGESIASVTAAGGRFHLTNIAPGTYSLCAEAPPLRGLLQRFVVQGALPVHIELRVSPVLTEQIVVRSEGLDQVSSVTRVTLAGDAIRRAPARLRSRGLQDAIATTPEWATEDNGLLHVRGVNDGFLYVIDGMPVYERLDGLFGSAPDPAMIESINVLTGYSRRMDLTLRLIVLNLANRTWAYNFGNPFSGTHFGPGRTISLGARASFR